MANAGEVHFHNAPEGPVGILLDGRENGADIRHRALVGTAPILALPELEPRPEQVDEIVAFAPGRPPVSLIADWTSSERVREIAFPDPIALPVTVWILGGDFERVRARAVDDLLETDELFSAQCAGITLADWRFHDATKRPEASEFLAFHTARTDALQETVGFEPGRLNLYYVDIVAGETGNYSGGNGYATPFHDGTRTVLVIVMGRRCMPGLLAHELGHVFHLRHTDDIDADGLTDSGGNVTPPHAFGTRNVMASASCTRRYFTEGQVYRMHFDLLSQLNCVYGLRGDRPKRLVPSFGASRTSPPANIRLWDDGLRATTPRPALERVWLWRDCDHGAGAALVESIRKHAGRLRSWFQKVLEDGPPRPLLEEFRQALPAWQTLRERAQQRPRLQRILAARQAAKTKHRIKDQVQAVRERAIAALIQIGDAQALAPIRAIAKNKKHPLHLAARLGLTSNGS